MARVALLLLAVLFSSALADVALCRDGKKVNGTLRLSPEGRLAFSAGGRTLSLAELRGVRFPGSPPPFRAGVVHHLRFGEGERLSGVFLGLARDELLLRTAWAGRLAVPRRAATSLGHLPGWRTLYHGGFEGKATFVKTEGDPKTKGGTLTLAEPGQTWTAGVAERPVAGRVGVNFQPRGEAGERRWALEAVFRPKTGPRTVRVVLFASGPSLAAEGGGLEGTAQTVAHAKELRRLVLEFSPGSLRIRCDDDVLWYALDGGPGGPLTDVRLVCEGPKGENRTGSVAFSGLCVESALSGMRRPAGEPGHDELWLKDGDQVFGEVVAADARAVTLKTRRGQRPYPWPGLRGWYPRREGRKPAARPAPVVRVYLHSGVQEEPDVLLGTLAAFGEREAKLRHADLGELVIPRTHLAAVEPVDAP